MAGGKRLRYDPVLMNLPPLHLLLAVALLWRGLMPVGVMAMPGETGFEVRLCGLSGGTVVLDFGLDEADPQPAMDHGGEHCPLCASVASVALPTTVDMAMPAALVGRVSMMPRRAARPCSRLPGDRRCSFDATPEAASAAVNRQSNEQDP